MIKVLFSDEEAQTAWSSLDHALDKWERRAEQSDEEHVIVFCRTMATNARKAMLAIELGQAVQRTVREAQAKERNSE